MAARYHGRRTRGNNKCILRDPGRWARYLEENLAISPDVEIKNDSTCLYLSRSFRHCVYFDLEGFASPPVWSQWRLSGFLRKGESPPRNTRVIRRGAEIFTGRENSHRLGNGDARSVVIAGIGGGALIPEWEFWVRAAIRVSQPEADQLRKGGCELVSTISPESGRGAPLEASCYGAAPVPKTGPRGAVSVNAVLLDYGRLEGARRCGRRTRLLRGRTLTDHAEFLL